MLKISCRHGMLCKIAGSSAKIAPAIIGNAEFFAPRTCTMPCSGLPPCISILSNAFFPMVRIQRLAVYGGCRNVAPVTFYSRCIPEFAVSFRPGPIIHNRKSKTQSFFEALGLENLLYAETIRVTTALTAPPELLALREPGFRLQGPGPREFLSRRPGPEQPASLLPQPEPGQGQPVSL